MSRGVAFGGLSGPKLKDWEILVDDCSRTRSHNHSLHRTDGTTGTLVEFVPVVAIPLLICLSTVGNCLNIIVLCRYCRSGAKRIFLLALAVSDMVVMWSTLPRYLTDYSDVFGIDPNRQSALLRSFGLFTWLHYTFAYVTDWILMAFSMERLATFRFRQWRKQSRARWKSTLLLILVFFIVSALMNSGILVWYYDSWDGYGHVDHYIQPEWIASWVRHQQELNIAFPVVVVICLLASNLYLLVYLRSQLKSSSSLQEEYGRFIDMQRKPKAKETGQGSRISVGETKRRKPCRMLIACVLLYSLTQAPNVVLNTVDHFSNAPYCYNLLKDYEAWEPLVTTLALVNYAGNFYVYVLMSSTYRTALKDSFRRHIKHVCRPSKTDRPTFSRCGSQGNLDKERGLEGEKSPGTCTDFDWMSLASHVSVLFSASRKASDEPAKSRLRKVRHPVGGHPRVTTEKFRLASLENIALENQTLSNNAHRNSL